MVMSLAGGYAVPTLATSHDGASKQLIAERQGGAAAQSAPQALARAYDAWSEDALDTAAEPQRSATFAAHERALINAMLSSGFESFGDVKATARESAANESPAFRHAYSAYADASGGYEMQADADDANRSIRL